MFSFSVVHWKSRLTARSYKSYFISADCKDLLECLGKAASFLLHGLFLSEAQCKHEYLISRRKCVWVVCCGFPSTVVVLCRCRCGLLPLHGGGGLELQRPGPEQLHLTLGGPGGAKGKKNSNKETKQLAEFTFDHYCFG